MARNILRSVPTLHRRQADLLARSAKGRGARTQARDELVAELSAHLHASHEVLHPVAEDRSVDLRDGLIDLRSTDEKLLSAVRRLAELEPDDDEYAAAADEVRRTLDEHAQAEQALLERGLGDLEAPKLRELGAHHERALAATRRTMQPARNGSQRRFAGSRADLYERARRAGVPGRSAMSREQLIAALKERGAH